MKLSGIKIIEYFKPKNWFSWLRGKIIGKDLPQEYVEQFMYRYSHPECQKCVEKGKCIHCGCDTYEKMLDPYSVCTGSYEDGEPFWGAMTDKNTWNEYKNLVGLKFSQNKTKVVDGSN